MQLGEKKIVYDQNKWRENLLILFWIFEKQGAEHCFRQK